MRHPHLVLGFVVVILVIDAGCISISFRESDISRSLLDTSTVTQPHIVAAAVTRQGNTMSITWQGGPDAGIVTELYYGTGSTDKTWGSPKTGESVTLSGGTPGKDHVIVVATFADGVEQVDSRYICLVHGKQLTYSSIQYSDVTGAAKKINDGGQETGSYGRSLIPIRTSVRQGFPI